MVPEIDPEELIPEDGDAVTMTPVGQLGYEACRDELIEVVQLLERGGLDLDKSLKLWERGEQLATRCEEHLAGARQRVAETLEASATKRAAH